MTVEIILKDTSEENIDTLNAELAKSSFDERFQFLSMKNIDSLLNDINNNSSSSDRHLKPDDGDLTFEGLKSVYGQWTNVGEISFDVLFDRTSENDMTLALEFISRHHLDIKRVNNMAELLERSGLEEKHAFLGYLGDNPSQTTTEYPKDEQELTSPSSGVLLSHWGADSNPMYTTIYGNVDSPQLAKTKKQRINPEDNSLARDSNGHPVIVLPLLKADGTIGKQIDAIYSSLFEMGIRESFDSFVLQQYGAATAVSNINLPDLDEAKRVYSQLKSHLSLRELDVEGHPKNVNQIRNKALRTNLIQVMEIFDLEPQQTARMG